MHGKEWRAIRGCQDPQLARANCGRQDPQSAWVHSWPRKNTINRPLTILFPRDKADCSCIVFHTLLKLPYLSVTFAPWYAQRPHCQKHPPYCWSKLLACRANACGFPGDKDLEFFSLPGSRDVDGAQQSGRVKEGMAEGWKQSWWALGGVDVGVRIE